MEKELEALIRQLQKNNENVDSTNASIEALIKQNENLNIQPELEALITQSQKLIKLMKDNRNSLKNAIKSIEFPEQKEIDLSSIDKTNKLLEELLKEQQKECKISVNLILE